MDVDEPAGEITLARRGMAALELLSQLPPDISPAALTADQRTVLAGWCGWGPLAKALNYDSSAKAWQDMGRKLYELLGYEARNTAKNACDTAFYTPKVVTRAMWDLVQALGVTGPIVALEPGCGRGSFIAGTPDGVDADWTGVEADDASAQVARLLNPAAQIIHKRMEQTRLRQGGFDLAMGTCRSPSRGCTTPTPRRTSARCTATSCGGL